MIWGNMLSGCRTFDQSLAGFNIEAVNSFTGMLTNVYLSLINYDALLTSWGTQNAKAGKTLDANYCVYTSGGAVEAARTHLISDHTWTINDGGAAFDNGKLLITFDDGLASTYTTAYPELLSRGLTATFYIITDKVGTAGYVTWANLQTMAANGMDIQCHTQTSTNMTTLTEAQIITSLTNVNTAFTTNSLASPVHLAYPSGGYNANVITYITSYRSTARIATGNYMGKGVNKYIIPSYIMDTTSKNNNKIQIDYAVANKRAAAYYGHNVATGDQNPISLIDFQELLDYAIASGIDVITISGLYAFYLSIVGIR